MPHADRRIWPSWRVDSPRLSVVPWESAPVRTDPSRPQPIDLLPLSDQIDAKALQDRLLEIQAKVRGPIPTDELIVVDGKEPRHGPGEAILGAVTVPGQFLMGCARVDTKTNEVPVARELFGTMDLAGRTVSMDALHTCEQTARELVVEHGAHYLMSVKGNQPTLQKNINTAVPAPTAGFSPLPQSSTEVQTVEINRGKREVRTLRGRAVSAEDIGFPFAAQVARVLRQRKGRKEEEVGLITDLEPEELSASQWLKANRNGWG